MSLVCKSKEGVIVSNYTLNALHSAELGFGHIIRPIAIKFLLITVVFHISQQQTFESHFCYGKAFEKINT